MSVLRTLAEQLFRASFLAFPRRLRVAFAEEAREAFRADLQEREGARGRHGPLWFTVRATANALREGIRERIRRGPLPGHGATTQKTTRRKTMWGGLGLDVRHAVRSLLRSPGLTVAAVVVLALGLGANATVFSALKSTVLAPLPYADAEALVMADIVAFRTSRGERRVMPWSYPKFQTFAEAEGRLLDPVAGYGGRTGTISAPGDPERIHVEVVTPDYFRVLGVDMVLGRGFGPAEGDPANPPMVVVVSHGVWESRFGADRGALGSDVILNGRPVTIVGVAPTGFDGLSGGAAAWVPVLASEALFNRFMIRGARAHWMRAVGRLTEGTSFEEALAQIESMGASVEAAYPSSDPGWEYSTSARRLSDVRVNGRASSVVWLLTAAALLVLLVACANLSGLLLARSRQKGRDGAVRLAVGASRWRVVRGTLVESLLLALAGGALGVVLAIWGARGLALLWPRRFLSSTDRELRFMSPDAIAVDGSVLAFSVVISVAAAVAVGLWPALRASSVNLATTLKDGGAASRGRRGALDPRAMLVAAQVGLALVLVVGTGLVGSSIVRLLGEERGFNAENVLVFSYALPGSSAVSEDPNTFHDEFRERLLRIPSVEHVTSGCPPLRGHCWGITRVDALEGGEPIPQGEGPEIGITMAGDTYFETLGVRLLSGRALGPEDGLDGQPTGVINERAAQILFPGGDPVGRKIQVGVTGDGKEPLVEIVGVVENVMYDAPDQEQFAELYYSHREFPDRAIWMLIRTSGNPMDVVPMVRNELTQMATDVALAELTTVEEVVRGSVGDRRLLFTLMVVFAALTLALSATGTWGVVSNSVVDRRRELGLRLALGAGRQGVIGLVLRASVRAAAVGIVGGTVAAWTGSRLLEAFLYETSQSDPLAYGLGAALLMAVVVAAAWLPARRATRVDPVEALRAQ